jgi:hypothetical protein
VPVLIAVWSYSNYPFVMAMPGERTEAILAGMVEAFRFFGCVPHEVWWDNPRTVASQIFRGRDRRVNEAYAALASHYRFDPLFCMPARGNEKPYAETRVRVMQRQWATPVPCVADLNALNAMFRARCAGEVNRTVAGYSESIGQRFERDRAEALALPTRPFDACIMKPAQVDKYQTVRFDRNRYSVPRTCAFQAVMVKGYTERIEVVAAGNVVARHQRSYGRDEQILDPLHYLAALGRRPAALDHAPVLRDWQLAASFTQLREALEKRHGKTAGPRHFVRVLQLLAEYSMDRVQAVVESCLAKGELDVAQVEHLVTGEHADSVRDLHADLQLHIRSDAETIAVVRTHVGGLRIDATSVGMPARGEILLIMVPTTRTVSCMSPKATLATIVPSKRPNLRGPLAPIWPP